MPNLFKDINSLKEFLNGFGIDLMSEIKPQAHKYLNCPHKSMV
jgi:hypothetical protein